MYQELQHELQHEFRDVKYLKTWIEKDCQASIQNLDAGAILQEFIRLAGRCEKTYLEQGQADKRAYRESILLSFKRLQEHLADKKLVYAPFVPVPVTKYSEPVNKLSAKFASPATKAWDHKKVLEAEENLKNENERRKLIKENNIKQWIVRRHFGSKKDQDVDLVLREFTRLTTGDEKTYVESGIEQSEFNGPDKKDERKKIFASFQALQNMLKANKLMYVPLTDLPAGAYYALIIKEMREEFERINKVSEIKFRTYEDLLLEEEEEKQKNEKERRTLIRQKSQIKTLLKEELDRQKMSETTVDQVLAEFKLIESGHDKYVEHYPGDQFKGQVNQERRQKILSFYDKFKNDYKDESGLKSWFKGHITPQLPNQDFNLIWQELRIICGYSKEEYLKLGQRQSNFGGPENLELRGKLYDCYMQLVEHLAENKLMYAPFTPLKNFYPELIIDESQDFSLLQLKSLLQHAIDHNATFFYDRLQVLMDRMINKKAISKSVARMEKCTLRKCTLNENYRSKKEVCKFINRAILIRNVISEDKFKGYMESGVTGDKGAVHFMQDSAKAKNQMSGFISSSHDWAVLTLPECVEEAKKKFGTTDEQGNFIPCAKVFTIDDIKGLQYENVVLYHFLAIPDKKRQRTEEEKAQTTRLIEANAKLAGIDLNTIDKKTRSKNKDEKVDPHWNNFVTGCTRAKTRLVIFEDFADKDQAHKLKNLHHAVHEGKGAVELISLGTVKESTAEDYLESAAKLRDNGNEIAAKSDYRKYLEKKNKKTITTEFLEIEFNKFVAAKQRDGANEQDESLDDSKKQLELNSSSSSSSSSSTPAPALAPVIAVQRIAPAPALITSNVNNTNTPSPTSTASTTTAISTPTAISTVIPTAQIINNRLKEESEDEESEDEESEDEESEDDSENEDDINRIISSLTDLFTKNYTSDNIKNILGRDNILRYLFEYQITHKTNTCCLIEHVIADPSKHELFLKVLKKKPIAEIMNFMQKIFFSTRFIKSTLP